MEIERDIFSSIIIIIHASISANKILSRKTLSQLIYIAWKILGSSSLKMKLIDNAIDIRATSLPDLNIVLSVLKNNGLIIEDADGNITFNEKLGYVLNDLISDKDNIMLWKLIHEISRLSDYTISKITEFLCKRDIFQHNRFVNEEEEMIRDILITISNRMKIFSR